MYAESERKDLENGTPNRRELTFVIFVASECLFKTILHTQHVCHFVVLTGY